MTNGNNNFSAAITANHVSYMDPDKGKDSFCAKTIASANWQKSVEDLA